jgi:transcriptional regulator with XRE-family HTH domain
VLEIGSSLREARRRQGLELSDAADAIMVRARFLEALESERFELLPEGPYLRSFLREYAEFLGLDGDILVTELMLRFAPRELEPPEASKGHRPARLWARLPPRRGVLVTAAVVGVGAGVWWLGQAGPTTVRASLPTLDQRAAPPTHIHVPVVAAPVVHHAPPVLTLSAARGPCWLMVRRGSSSGPVVAETTLEPGRTIQFGLKQPLWIRIGAPWNLDAAIGGRIVTTSLPGVIGNVLVSTRGLRAAA